MVSFLTFPNGNDVITADTPNVVEEFKRTIRRQETLDVKCFKMNPEYDPEYEDKNCPSGDERAIYAVNRAIDRGHSQFFQKDHLAVVILSDEDERSQGGEGYEQQLEDYDLPETLVSKVKTQLGARKTLSVHPIIIRKEMITRNEDGSITNRGEDVACFKEQNSQAGVKGYYGTVYEQLANPSDELKALGGLVDGHTGSICAVDYGDQLEEMGSKIVTNSQIQKLPCQPEILDDDLEVTFSPSLEFDVNFTVDENNFLTMDSAIPAGTIVNVKINCPLTI